MSADLFAEFAGEPKPSQGQQTAAPARAAAQPASDFSFFDGINTAPAQVTPAQPPPQQQQVQAFAPSSLSAPANEEHDDWGDFEGGSSTVEPAHPIRQDPFAFTSPISTEPASKIGSFDTHDPFAFDLSPSHQQDQSAWQKAPVVKAKKSADPSVLFDAENDLDDDDDFGDFEGTDTNTNAPASATGSSALVDLLGDLNVSQAAPLASKKSEDVVHAQSSKMTSTRKSPVGGFGTMAKPATATEPAPPPEDDGWDTFDDWEASIPNKRRAKSKIKADPVKSTATAKGSVSPAPILSPTTDDPQPGELPPTNVPPPGVLLSLFPSLFADAQEKLFKPMAAQTLPMRNKLMAEPATIAYLQGYLMICNVAAHIIAGRKLRWKRDQHLSQGMRIGPASSRATSGMKLTGIDKGENLKEEREVSDVVRTWKEQVGRLRHVVSGVNQIKAGTLDRGPDLHETMHVKTLKQSEGGIPARQPCMMCGLKREERVTAADIATDDSFGEWWIDQVNMHRGTVKNYLQVYGVELTQFRLSQLLEPAQGCAPTALTWSTPYSDIWMRSTWASVLLEDILYPANDDQRGARDAHNVAFADACARQKAI